MSSGTTSPSKVQRMRLRGRTQRSLPAPEVIDLGQGKLLTTASMISAAISEVGRPWRERVANQTPSRSTS